MLKNIIKIGLTAVSAAVLLAGCNSSVRGPQMFAGVNGDPHCAPGPKPCPRDLYPEFPLPPGGPYLQTPAYAGQQSAPPARLNINSSQNDKLTIAK